MLEPDEIALVFGRPDPLLRQLIIRAGFAPMILQRADERLHNAGAPARPGIPCLHVPGRAEKASREAAARHLIVKAAPTIADTD